MEQSFSQKQDGTKRVKSPQSIFLSLEKRNHSKKCIKKLQLNDSTITDNPAIILEVRRTKEILSQAI